MAVIRMNYRSTALHRATNVIVILPTDLSKEGAPSVYVPGVKYQTLWLLHGGLGDGEEFVNFSNIVRYADEARVAVVIPTCESSFYEEPYYGFVTDELPKVLQTLFPISPRREDNFIGGLSHGGDCAMKASFEYPERYAAALIMSAAGTDHRGEVETASLRFDVYGLAEKHLVGNKAQPKLIFATGNGDRGFPYYTPVIDKLEGMGVKVERIYMDGEGHSWPFWDTMLERALKEWFPLRHEVIFPE